MFQMRCLKDILGFALLDKMRNEDILKLTGQIPIEEELRKRRLQWFGHVQRMDEENSRRQKRILKRRLAGKKRKPGGTSFPWVDTISRDL